MADDNKGPETSSEINGLIFKELIKRGYSLEGNTRVWNIADSKLWYITPEQAQGYLDLEDSESYQALASGPEYELIENNIDEVIERIGNEPVNVVDLGCGDGNKAAHIVEHLISKGLEVRYCPIDISGYLVQKAVETFSKKKIGEIVETKWNISDFENLDNVIPLMDSGKFKKNLFLLLGQTLGNFELNEILYSIRNAMRKKDIFVAVVGVVHPKWEERAKNAKNDKKMNSFLAHIPRQLGLKEDEIEFGSRFKNSRIEFYYTIKVDKKVTLYDKSVYFQKGDQVIVLVAYKKEKQELLEIMNMHFDEVLMKIHSDNATALIIATE